MRAGACRRPVRPAPRCRRGVTTRGECSPARNRPPPATWPRGTAPAPAGAVPRACRPRPVRQVLPATAGEPPRALRLLTRPDNWPPVPAHWRAAAGATRRAAPSGPGAPACFPGRRAAR
ncbi:hypothetical protein G6F62_013839 [Rhizopus arrhizus]|nr:hypothetical protein G6F62_013839 [Rhizopus arrhizus]